MITNGRTGGEGLLRTLIAHPFNRSNQVQLMLYAIVNPAFVEEFTGDSLSKTNVAWGVKEIFQQ